MNDLKTPAFCEEAVLSGVMAHNEAFHEVSPLISADHFTSPLRQRLWTAIRERVLAGEPADAVTISDALPNDSDEIYAIANGYATRAVVVDYARIVRTHWRRRQAATIAQRLMAGVRANEDGAIDAAVADLLNLNAAQSECEFTGKQAMLAAWKQVEEAHANGGLLPGITTGLRELDDILGGWHDSDLTLVGARPAMGKTALLVNLAEASSGAGYLTGLFSAEQPAIQLGLRRLSLATTVSATALRSGKVGDNWAGMHAGLKRTCDRPILIYDRSAISLDELIGVARKWKHAHGLQVLFIDYAQRITVPGADRITEVSQVARGLKNLARDLNVPVIALAQVKASVDARPDKRPTAGDLANSDELTREADQVLMLYRDEIANRNSTRKGTAEVLIEKNRHGPTGFVELAFHAETMRFGDLARDTR
jgi:replicative DNA helicase